VNLRHAAALTLMGWYLMVPPLNTDGRVEVTMRFTKWTQLASYDSASACQKVLFAFQQARELKPATDAEWKEARDSAVRTGKQPPLNSEEMNKQVSESRCIASDDPRLKVN